MLLWGDWSLHGLQAIPGMHGRFDERPCPAESARSPTADRADPIRTPRNVAGNLPLPDADLPAPCTRLARDMQRRARECGSVGGASLEHPVAESAGSAAGFGYPRVTQ